jgi:hypothetical protein
MPTKVASVVLTVLFLAGCAATTPAPRFSAVSPADAEAPEAATPPPELSLAAEAEVRAPEMPAEHPAGPTAGEYSCPMHPGVKQASPGSCPKCGMQLVKPKDARQRP